MHYYCGSTIFPSIMFWRNLNLHYPRMLRYPFAPPPFFVAPPYPQTHLNLQYPRKLAVVLEKKSKSKMLADVRNAVRETETEQNVKKNHFSFQLGWVKTNNQLHIWHFNRCKYVYFIFLRLDKLICIELNEIAIYD